VLLPFPHFLVASSFFSDPSSAAVGCAKTGPIQIADNIVMGKEGEVRV
jgi:catabolite regulation protein CreA